MYPTQEIEDFNKLLAPDMRIQLGYLTDVIYLQYRADVGISGLDVIKHGDQWPIILRDRAVVALQSQIDKVKDVIKDK